jgi:hypothetical protein
MLRIGKANQFYTLWDVTNETRYNSQQMAYEVTHFCFMGNLSKDLKQAQQKAQSRGCKDLTPDESLRGQTRWESSGVEYKVEEATSLDCFEFGKYRGKNISQMIKEDKEKHPAGGSDFQKYCDWYFHEQHFNRRVIEPESGECENNQVAIDRLVPELLSFIDWVKFENKDGKTLFMSRKDFLRRGVMDKLKAGKLRVGTLSNFIISDEYGINDSLYRIRVIPHGLTDDEIEAFDERHPYGMKILVYVPHLEMSHRYYNGKSFSVPKGVRSFKDVFMNIKLKDDWMGKDLEAFKITHIVTPHKCTELNYKCLND